MALTRRNLLQIGGATGAALAASPALEAFDQFFQPAAAELNADTKVVSACGVCSPGCGLQATLRDGVVKFIEGLPGDESGRGALCGKGASAAGFIYDPDRLKYPMRRTNPKKGFDEDPGFVRISWDEALDTIASKLTYYRNTYGPDSLLFVTLPGPDVWVRLMNALGAINRIDHIDECFQTDRIISRYTIGAKTWCNDFENSKYILLFGWDIVAKAKLAYASGIVDAKTNGAKVVHFSPNYTATSRMSDEYINIRPGSDLAVALAMIHVIVGENLYNKEFVDSYTNFAKYESQIRAHFAEYTPEWAETLSEVPAATIRRIAREFAASKAGIVPAHKKTLCANYANATQLVHAIMILNILAGTIDRPGGRYFPRAYTVPGVDAIYPPPPYPPKTGVRIDNRDKLFFVNETDTGLFSALASGMLESHPGRIKMAFWNAYTALGFPRPKRIEEAMQAVEFVVAMDVLPTDTVAMADIVLPSTTYLEVSDIVTREYNAKFRQAVPRVPIVNPMFEVRGMGAVAIELGKRVAPEYFKKPDGNWINPAELLNEKTRRAGLGETFAEFRAKGLVEDRQPFVPRTTFSAPNSDGKCQIYVPQFADKGYEPLPKWHPKREQPSEAFPFYYITFIPAIHRRNSTQSNRILNEIMPANAAIINPRLAAQMNIKEGQMVRVISRVGEVQLPAHLSEVIRPDAVMIAHGFGHRSKLLTAAAGKGVRDGDLVPDSSVDEMIKLGNWGGSSCIMDAVVSVVPL
jgi:thiosulfate reductase/polysulfide reductase chain A